jgi:hypothetical protein
LEYCAFGTGLNASSHVGLQIEAVQPMNMVDRTHKGDRLTGAQETSASDLTPIGKIEPQPVKVGPDDALRLPRVQPKLPDGCEPALSPLTDAKRKSPAARCLT